jgi:hypothetical protein
MHLAWKTLLNHVERLKGFVYESSRLIEGRVRGSRSSCGPGSALGVPARIAGSRPPATTG